MALTVKIPQITGWRVYYADGTIFTSKTTIVWSDVPSDGALGLVVFFDDGTKRRITGGDYYFIDMASAKYGMDKGQGADLALKYPGAFLVRGMWTNDSAMVACEARMKSDFSP